MFEELYGFLVVFGFRASTERAQVLTFPGFGINLARIESVVTGFQFANHGNSPFFGYRLGTGSPGFGGTGSPGGGTIGSGEFGVMGIGVGVPGSTSGGKTGSTSGNVLSIDMAVLPKPSSARRTKVLTQTTCRANQQAVLQIRSFGIDFALNSGKRNLMLSGIVNIFAVVDLFSAAL
jgi:hypothetical protein